MNDDDDNDNGDDDVNDDDDHDDHIADDSDDEGDSNNNDKTVCSQESAKSVGRNVSSTHIAVVDEGRRSEITIVDETSFNEPSREEGELTKTLVPEDHLEPVDADEKEDNDEVNRSIAVSEAESVGIVVEDYDEAEGDASTSSSTQSLKRKADVDENDNRKEMAEEVVKGPKIKRVVEVKGKYRWDVYSDSNLIKNCFEKDTSLEEIPLDLTCFLGGDRLTDPIRIKNCSHLEVFDRRNLFIFTNVYFGKLRCPYCDAAGPVEGGQIVIEVSQVFFDILSKTCGLKATLYRDGTWDPEGEEKPEDEEDAETSVITETIAPEDTGPKVVQIYQDGEKKSFKVENEDQMMRLVGSKWGLTSFPRRDKNRTVSNFRKRRLQKSGCVLVGRSLLERNESPLYRSNDDDDDGGAPPRGSRKRKRTVEQLDQDKKVLVDKFVRGVLERQLEDLAKQKQRMVAGIKAKFDRDFHLCSHDQKCEVQRIAAHMQMSGASQKQMFDVGREMRVRHEAQLNYLKQQQMENLQQCEIGYNRNKQRLEFRIRQDVTQTTLQGVPSKHKEAISQRGEETDDIVPAVLCGGNEKTVKTTYLPIDCVEAILKENEAYRQIYGMDDKVNPRPRM